MDKPRYQKTLTAILLIAFFVLFPHFVPLPFFSYAIVCFAVLMIYLKKRNKSLADLGFKWKALSVHTFIAGLLSAIIWMAFIKLIYFPFINYFFKDYIQAYTEYDFIKHNFTNLLIIIVAAWIVGGCYEEIIFRGFILRTTQGWFVRSASSFWLAGLLTSVLFGLYHWQQGVFGVVPATLGALYWTYLLKRYDGNLWYPMISHALYDTIALTMIYLDVLHN